MKRILVTILVGVLCISSLQAQKHFTFKGVEINGSIQYFSEKLKKEIPDLKKEYVDATGIYTGSFAGVRDCHIIMYPNVKGDTKMVVVAFPSTDDYGTLKSQYDKYCTLMTEKYGEPAASFEEYDGYVSETNDSRKMDLISQGKATITTHYELENGTITVLISKDAFSTIATALGNPRGAVLIYYNDAKNDNVDKKAEYDDL